jgi:uncharacterized coiled-coil DUF342 family protein
LAYPAEEADAYMDAQLAQITDLSSALDSVIEERDEAYKEIDDLKAKVRILSENPNNEAALLVSDAAETITDLKAKLETAKDALEKAVAVIDIKQVDADKGVHPADHQLMVAALAALEAKLEAP